jgi:hypothetical protein
MYFIVAMIYTSIYHMDPLCIVFVAMDISYDFITHGSIVHLIWQPFLHHTHAWEYPTREETILLIYVVGTIPGLLFSYSYPMAPPQPRDYL